MAPIASLQSWLQAWSTFAEVLSAIFPSCAPHLWRYQAFIVRSSQRFQTAAWLQYDMLFRRKIAIDSDLVASCLAADTLLPQLACYTCGTSGHLASECPTRQASSSTATCHICKAPGHYAPHLSAGFQPKATSSAKNIRRPRPNYVQAPQPSAVNTAAPSAPPYSGTETTEYAGLATIATDAMSVCNARGITPRETALGSPAETPRNSCIHQEGSLTNPSCSGYLPYLPIYPRLHLIRPL